MNKLLWLIIIFGFGIAGIAWVWRMGSRMEELRRLSEIVFERIMKDIQANMEEKKKRASEAPALGQR